MSEDDRFWLDVWKGVAKWLLITFLIIALLVIFGPIIYHQWWVSVHCTMILGTQVCR